MFFNNYSKPGKGVEKRDPNKPLVYVFFEILPRKLWKLCKLNLLYMVTMIPTFIITFLVMGFISKPILNHLPSLFDDSSFFTSVIWYDYMIRSIFSFLFAVFWGQGPITTAFTFINCEYGEEHHCWLFSDFFEKARQHFRQSFLLYLIDLIVVVMLFISFALYVKMQMMALSYVVVIILFIYTIIHIYIYQIMLTGKQGLWNIFKDSLFLAFGKPLQSILFFVVMVIFHAIIPLIIILQFANVFSILIIMLLEILLFPALANFITSFFINHTIQQYIKK